MCMSTPLPAPDILDRDFLEIRAKLLEIAASFDRLDRAEGSVDADPRMKLIREALEVFQDVSGDRAEQIQLVFSRPYKDDWQTTFGIALPSS